MSLKTQTQNWKFQLSSLTKHNKGHSCFSKRVRKTKMADGTSFPIISLSSDQIRDCTLALDTFKNKLRHPDVIDSEFVSLKEKTIQESEMTRLCSVGVDEVNLNKNRYPDVLPFDDTRVVLDSCKDYSSSARGYINANIVKTPTDASPEFIATQGPLPHTFQDFWEMVLQYRCPAIVMLTSLVDHNKVLKCDDYFKTEDCRREFGDISIVLTKPIQKTDTSLLLRHFEVTKPKSEEPSLSVLHIQYPEWPDHGVPDNTLTVQDILNHTFKLSHGLGPIMVHCSAGIGRTGAYCTIHDTIQRILAGDLTALDVANTVAVFRSQRNGMVQTLDQYKFCYKVIVDKLEELMSRYNAEKQS